MVEPLWDLGALTVPGADAPRLEGVSLRIGHGITAILGASGAGKSTLCEVLVGYARGWRGTLLQAPPDRRVPIAWGPADALWPDVDVRGHLVAVGGRQVDALLASFDLTPLSRALPPRLSAGERDRLTVARALASDARAVVLDEPFAHVAREDARRYWRALMAWARCGERALVYATHAPEAVIGHADRVICLSRGRVLAHGEVGELYDRPGDAATARCLGEANWFDADERLAWLGDRGPGCVRPERLVISADERGDAVVRASTFHGAHTVTEVERAGVRRELVHRAVAALSPGARVAIRALLAFIACVLAGCGDGAATLTPRANDSVMLPGDGEAQPSPRGLGADGADAVLVLDTVGRVLRYDARMQLRGQWRMPEWSVGRPEGVLRLDDGRVVVADTHYHRVVVFAHDGAVQAMWGHEGTALGEFTFPVSVACDDRGDVYVGEYGGNDRIQVFAADGTPQRAIGSFGSAPGRFQRPQGVAWRGGRLYVADAMNNRVQVFADDGAFIGVLGDGAIEMRFPYNVAFDAQGRLWTVEFAGNRITAIDVERGRVLARYGAPGRGQGEFSTPWGMTVSRDGAVWVADTGNRRLTRVLP